MSNAIWAIHYRVRHENRARYVAWFHDVHVAEKLARPGYTWAAHYQRDLDTDPDHADYLALFGAECTRVFYEPSPAQLKLTQDALTREMMGLRVGSRWTIFAEEWRHANGGSNAVRAPALRVTGVEAGAHEEALAAWCAQRYFPELASAAGFQNARKWFGSSGAVRHALIEEFESAAQCKQAPRTALDDEDAAVAKGTGRPATFDQRLWPAT